MTFSSLEGDPAELSALKSEYGAARQIGSVRLGELRLYFRAGRKVFYLPYRRITRCFRRVEMIPAKLCCGRGDLSVENLVICGEGQRELAQIRLPGERAGKALLEELRARAPEARFGRPEKPAGEENA